MSEYNEKVKAIHRSFGIPENYESRCSLALQIEEVDVISIGDDIYGRPQKMTAEASDSWQEMKSSSGKEGIVLKVVSAFRSVDKQTQIIQRKVDAGQSVSEILKVCTAPGYSEHHTGRAIDLTTIGCEPLSEAFESTEAFKWLDQNAHHYSFKMSYPKGNNCGILYEPWHWIFYT